MINDGKRVAAAESQPYNLVPLAVDSTRQASTSAAIAVAGSIGGIVAPIAGYAMINSGAVFIDGTPVYTVGLIRLPFILGAATAVGVALLAAAIAVYERRWGSLQRRAMEREAAISRGPAARVNAPEVS